MDKVKGSDGDYKVSIRKETDRTGVLESLLAFMEKVKDAKSILVTLDKTSDILRGLHRVANFEDMIKERGYIMTKHLNKEDKVEINFIKE